MSAAEPGQNPGSLAAQSVAATAPAALSRESAALRGIAYMLLSVGLFSIMDAMVKWLGATYPTMQLVFFRSLFAFLPLAVAILHGGGIAGLRIHNRRDHALRCVIGITAMTLFFYAFAKMPLAEVIAIGFAAPLFITALSVPLLGEPVGPRRWAAVLAGFLGVMIMVQPGSGVFDPIAVVPLVGTVFYALAAIYVRKLSRSETNTSIVFSFTLTCTLVSAGFLPFQWITPGLPDLAMLIGIGIVGGLAQLAMTSAFRHGDVAIIVPFEYSAMIWGVLLGFFIWGEIPGNHIWIGVAIVMASGLYIVYREANLGLRRGVGRKLQVKR